MPTNATRLGAVIIIIFCSIGYYIANSYPRAVGFFPKFLFIATIILSLSLFFRSYFVKIYMYNFKIKNAKQVIVSAVVAALYVVCVCFLGYYIASAAFIVILSLLLKFQNKLAIVLVSLAYPLLVYVVFEYLLHIPVPGIGI